MAVCLASAAALTACSDGGSLVTLAKLEGWGGHDDARSFADLEVAYDDATARALWDEHGAAALPTRSGRPEAPGRYGDLADVDLDTHVLVLWSSGESGTCPTWLTGLRTTDEGVTATEYAGYGSCTADYVPYRLVVAVPRSALPAAEDLPVPIVDANVPDAGVVRAYRPEAGGGDST